MIPSESLRGFSVGAVACREVLRPLSDMQARIREAVEEELVVRAWRQGFLLVDPPAGRWRFYRWHLCVNPAGVEVPVVVALHDYATWDFAVLEASAVGRRVRTVALTG